jgi:non-lysosomal glucosylceramidase
VNGISPDGSVVKSNEQIQEVWTGTTFGLASMLLAEGLETEAYRTAWGIYHVTYEVKGYWFRTPEAWDITGNFRASMYLRPGAIWAMEMAQPLPSRASTRRPGSKDARPSKLPDRDRAH